jgi:hypothetical protein
MRKNDNTPAFATVHAGFLQIGLTKKEYVITSITQGLLAEDKWKGIEEGFPDRVKAITETVLKLMDEKA